MDEGSQRCESFDSEGIEPSIPIKVCRFLKSVRLPFSPRSNANALVPFSLKIKFEYLFLNQYVNFKKLENYVERNPQGNVNF